MSKLEKMRDRICASPTPADITWAEISSLLRKLGYTELSGAGSRRKFYNAARDLLINCHQPHPQPTMPRYAVEAIVDHLKSNDLL